MKIEGEYTFDGPAKMSGNLCETPKFWRPVCRVLKVCAWSAKTSTKER